MTGGAAANRVAQILLLAFCVPMIWGWQFIHWESRPGNAVMTYTYTLYSRLPPPPDGPSFCRRIETGSYAVAIPCDWNPPFVWWLERRMR